MNTVYTVLESPHRWPILASASFTTACLGAIMMLAFTWRHEVALVWFYAFFLASLYFLARTLIDWKARLQAEATVPPKTRRR